MSAPVVAAATIASAGDVRLTVAAVLGIGVVVSLITWLKVHPFLALILGSAALGATAGASVADTVASFTKGVGDTVGTVGLLIALGAMIGGLLASSGGADLVVGSVVDRFSRGALPWAMAGVAALVGLPLFFEIGVVLLVPIVLLVARRSGVPVLAVGLPALAGLSVLHGLVPPHPGPLVAISALHADLGTTLVFGLVIAVPCVILAGPVFGTFISRRVHVLIPAAAPRPPGPVVDAHPPEGPGAATAPTRPRHRSPRLAPTVLTVLLPVVLMLARAVGELTLGAGTRARGVLDILGTPVVALLLGVVVAMITLGWSIGSTRTQVSASVGASLGPIAGILLIVAAGGGFKQTLVDAGVGDLVAAAAAGAHFPVLVLGWLVAVGIRLATGSATVATITAAGIVVPLAEGLSSHQVALLALAVGAGSLFFSHVNDAGFWLVKEYFGMTVGQTLATWSVMETIISVVGLVGVLLLGLVV